MHFDCKTSERHFSRSFDKRLDGAEKLAFGRHLGECESCRASYERYESVFFAALAMPGLRTEAAPPIPASAGGFRRRLPVSPRWRIAQGLAAAVLLATVGKVSYEFGASLDESAAPSTVAGPTAVLDRDETLVQAEGTVIDPIDVRMPSRPAGAYLRRLVDGTRSLGLLANATDAEADPDARRDVMTVVDGFVKRVELRDDARRLRALDATSLGHLTSNIHAFADDVIAVVDEDEDVRVRGRAAELRLIELADGMNERALPIQVRKLDRFARLFEPPTSPQEFATFATQRGDADILAAGCAEFTRGRSRDAANLIARVMSSPDATLRRAAQIYVVGVDLGALREQLSPPALDGPSNWISYNPSGSGVHFFTSEPRSGQWRIQVETFRRGKVGLARPEAFQLHLRDAPRPPLKGGFDLMPGVTLLPDEVPEIDEAKPAPTRDTERI